VSFVKIRKEFAEIALEKESGDVTAEGVLQTVARLEAVTL
jgi:hypothetical protein